MFSRRRNAPCVKVKTKLYENGKQNEMFRYNMKSMTHIDVFTDFKVSLLKGQVVIQITPAFLSCVP